MKSVLIIAVLLLAVGAYAAAETYSLRAVTTVEDTVTCAKDGGKAALVAPIDASGTPTEAWSTFCLLPAS